jgi:hypothetical protein
MKTNLIVGIVITLLMLCSWALLWNVYSNQQSYKDSNDALNKELMQAKLEIGKAHSQFTDLEKHTKEIEKSLQEEFKKNKEAVSKLSLLEGYINSTSKGKGQVAIIKETEYVTITNLVPGNLYQALTNTDLKNVRNIVYNFKDYRLTLRAVIQPKNNQFDNETTYELKQRFVGQMVETKTKSGAVNNYFKLWEVDDKKNKIAEFKLDKFEVYIEDLRENEFHWFNPKLDLGASFALQTNLLPTYSGSIGLSLMSYGLSKNDIIWRFGRVSLELQKNLTLGFSPVMYNLGHNIPVISNIWTGPIITVNRSSYGLGVFFGANL